VLPRPVKLNELEVGGFVLRAKEMLETHTGEGWMLHTLIAATPNLVRDDALDMLIQPNAAIRRGGAATRRVAVRVCALRQALAQVGFPNVILRADAGYLMRPAAAVRVQQWVLSTVRHWEAAA
jgi:hypothetical protein